MSVRLKTLDELPIPDWRQAAEEEHAMRLAAETEVARLKGELDDMQYTLDLCRITGRVAREDAERNAASAQTAWKMQQQMEAQAERLRELLAAFMTDDGDVAVRYDGFACYFCGGLNTHTADCPITRARAALAEDRAG